MRFLTLTTIMAGLAAGTTAHTVNCWGKALDPPLSEVDRALLWFDKIIANPTNPNFPPTAVANAHSCSSQYCQHKTSVRFCNDDNKVRYMRLQEIRNSVEVLVSTCQANCRGKRVAGGVIDHPDHWNVIVQADDNC